MRLEDQRLTAKQVDAPQTVSGQVQPYWTEVNSQGRLSRESLKSAPGANVDLVCLMAANNEVGTIYPFPEAADRKKSRALWLPFASVVALSLWVDGNLAGNRRMKRTAPAETPGYGRRLCRRREDVEEDFRSMGFGIRSHYDVWPHVYM